VVSVSKLIILINFNKKSMKKLFLSLSAVYILYSANPLTAQTTFSLPAEKSVWSTVHCNYFGQIPVYEKFAIQGTFKFLGKTYYKVYTTTIVGIDTGGFNFNNATYFGGIRQLGSRVYMKRNTGATQLNDYLLYDFGLNESETVTIYAPSTCGGENVLMKVLQVDSVDIAGIKRKRLMMDRINIADHFTEYWIDGIGSSFGLMAAGSACSDNSWYLSCYFSSLTGVVDMSGIIPVNFTFCLVSPQYNCGKSVIIYNQPINGPVQTNVGVEGKGNPVSGTTDDGSIQKDYSVYPNPVKQGGSITVKAPGIGLITGLQVHTLSGNAVQQKKVAPAQQVIITTETLKPGSYLLTIESQLRGENRNLVTRLKLVVL
jgi:hypothetical protein